MFALIIMSTGKNKEKSQELNAVRPRRTLGTELAAWAQVGESKAFFAGTGLGEPQ